MSPVFCSHSSPPSAPDPGLAVSGSCGHRDSSLSIAFLASDTWRRARDWGLPTRGVGGNLAGALGHPGPRVSVYAGHTTVRRDERVCVQHLQALAAKREFSVGRSRAGRTWVVTIGRWPGWHMTIKTFFYPYADMR